MKAVIFKGPHKVVIEDRPIPKIQDPTDIIVKVEKVGVLTWEIDLVLTDMQTALCGRYDTTRTLPNANWKPDGPQ